jgi:hypothetical protein
MTESVLSARAQVRLGQLQRVLQHELRALSEHNSRLLGALQACDFDTQYAVFAEFRAQVEAVAAAANRLRGFIDHYCASTPERREVM